MSRAFNFRRIPLPKPAPPRKLCRACQAFAAECDVPIGEGSMPACWECAHHIADHGVDPSEALNARCECTPDKIYPSRAQLDTHVHLEVERYLRESNN